MDELDYLLEDTRGVEVVTLSSDYSSLKTQFVRRVSKHITQQLGREIHVLDYDLQFSSYMNNLSSIEGIGEISDDRLLTVLQPGESDVDSSIARLASNSDLRPEGLIILDSINTFQGLIRNPRLDPDSVIANHKAAILTTILQQTVRYYSKSLWITNITRARPKVLDSGEVFWEREPAGGRMMVFKSGILLSLFPAEQGVHQEAKKVDSYDAGAVIRVDSVSAKNSSSGRDLKDTYSIKL